MNNQFKRFKVSYQFKYSVWTTQSMYFTALNFEQALTQCKNELTNVYGSEIMKEVKFNQTTK